MRHRIPCPAAIGSLTLASVLTTAVPRGAARDETRFVVLGDSQLNHRGIFERMIHEVEQLRPDFVVQVGDLIHGYTYNEDVLRREWRIFRRQIAPLTVPYHPVPGNHDVVTPQAEAVYAEVWGPDRFHYSFDHGAVHCVQQHCHDGRAAISWSHVPRLLAWAHRLLRVRCPMAPAHRAPGRCADARAPAPVSVRL